MLFFVEVVNSYLWKMRCWDHPGFSCTLNGQPNLNCKRWYLYLMRSAVWVTGHWVTEHKPVIDGIKRAESPSSPTELTLVPGTGKYFSIFVFLFLNLKIAFVIIKPNLLSFLGFFLIQGGGVYFFFYFLFLYCLMLSPIVLYYLSYCLS